MKTIEISDADYDSLMDLCKELQTQENDGQAHPYFWEPMSERYEQSAQEVGEVMFYHDCESYSAEEMWKNESGEWGDLKESFLELNDLKMGCHYESIEDEWISFVDNDIDYSIWHRELVEESEHNPSLFKSDVKTFIEGNKHHLGQKPHTYARTIWRMPKMIELVSILCRMNKQENADNEIKRKCHI